MTPLKLARLLAQLAAALSIVGACSSGSNSDPGPGDDASSTFVAFTHDFADFRSWPSYHSDGPAEGTVPVEVLGPRTQYLNHLPPPGRRPFRSAP